MKSLNIDTRIGTDNHHAFSNGNALPYTGVTFGMNYFAPQTDGTKGSWWFHPESETFQGFRVTHQPSPWMGDFSSMLISPFTGTQRVSSLYDIQATYRKHEAVFEPHYLKLYSSRYQLTNELTASMYGASIRLQGTQPISVALSAIHEIHLPQNKQLLEGWVSNPSGCEDPNLKMYFVFKMNQPGTLVQVNDFYVFQTDSNLLQIHASFSHQSLKQAHRNQNRECNDFDTMCDHAAMCWSEHLDRITIHHHNPKQSHMFRHCLYRAHLFPMTFHEYDEAMKPCYYNTKTHETETCYMVTNNGFWDTYKTVFPLMSLINHEHYAVSLKGFINHANNTGYLPKWLSPDERGLMPGTLIDAVICDAILKGIGTEDSEQLLELMVHAASTESPNSNYGRRAVNDYLAYGYVPNHYGESVNQTLDNAYSDFCIAQVAKYCGKPEQAETYLKRSYNYQNLFDSQTGFMRPRDTYGNFEEPFDSHRWGGAYTEGSAWQNSFGVYHDIQGLINLYGGAIPFTQKLDALVNQKPTFDVGSYGFEIHEMSEMAEIDFGQLAISNQPSFHIPYLYTYANKASSSQVLLRQLMTHCFSNSFPGDEDNGSMSAWYIFSALGFYPVCPGSLEYVIGIPLLDSAQIHLSNGNTFTITTHNNHPQCNFISEIQYNGSPYHDCVLTHEMLMSGGNLEITLGVVPNDGWFNEKTPYSNTKKHI
ncbi:cell wall anchor protein [Erysipelothrix piscisicarius]|uniref:Cell wall anchor protein n=1 Tax=Erysipelothrix piscisicarius TaxID=2485784 RepID=A0A3Q8S737_9FIRM|nr:GH92 family glycosyl hydrolase [Erysipelothrix piscisicarius]AZK43900.1 cell wall anchor protein [Erysipelothrix piscisicarius]